MSYATNRETAEGELCAQYEADGLAITARIAEMTGRPANRPMSLYQVFEGLNVDHSGIFDLRALAIAACGGTVKAQKEVDRAIWAERIRQDLGAVPRHALEYIHLYTAKFDWAVRANGAIAKPGNLLADAGLLSVEERLASEIMLHNLLLDARVHADCLYLKLGRDPINDAAQKWHANTKRERLAELIDDVTRPVPADDAADAMAKFRALVEQTFDHSDGSDPAFTAAALLRFVQQVKQKMLGLPVQRHCMPVICGKQGRGKSVFTQRLIAPIIEVSIPADFRAITEERNISIWENYCFYVDEMGYSTKSDIDIIKNTITAETLSRRPMRMNTHVEVPQRVTFIGTANAEDLADLIRDTTGTRRFVLLRYRDDADWAAVNSFDFPALWRAVDAAADDVLLPYRNVLEERQEEARERSSVERWVEGLTKAPLKLSATGLHETFREFEELHFPALKTSINQFGRDLRRLERMAVSPFRSRRTDKCMVYDWVEPVVDIQKERDQRTAAKRGHI